MVRIGSMLYGYCEGAFGRDALGDKRVEAMGGDWIVARMENGGVVFASFPNQAVMDDSLIRWENEHPDYR